MVAGRDTLTGNQSIPVPDVGDREQKLALAELTQYAATATELQQRYAAVEAAVAAISPIRPSTGRLGPLASAPRSCRPCRRYSATRRRTSHQPLISNRSTWPPSPPCGRRWRRSRRSRPPTKSDAAAAFAAAEVNVDEGRRHAGAWQAGLAKLLAA